MHEKEAQAKLFRKRKILKLPPVDESLSTPIAAPNLIVSQLLWPLQSRL